MEQMIGVLPKQGIHIVASPETTVTIAPLQQTPVHPVPDVICIGGVWKEMFAVFWDDCARLRQIVSLHTTGYQEQRCSQSGKQSKTPQCL